MANISAYLVLIVAVVLGTAANGFAKSAQGFTLLIPTLLTAVTIVACMYTLSLVMKSIPVGFTYATYGGLTITAIAIFGLIKYNQMPNIYGILGISLIVIGVVLINTLGKTNS